MKNIIKKNNKGFSLVELLVVIAVIGIIAAIAIPAMSGIFDKSRETKNRKNAQALCSAWAAAKQAGVPAMPTLTNGNPVSTTDMQTVATFFATVRQGTGVASQTKLALNVSGTDASSAAAFAKVDSGELLYTAGGD